MTHREPVLQRAFDAITLVAALATPLVLVALALDPPDEARTALRALNWVLWATFAVETLTMLAVSRDRERWLRGYPLTPVIAVLSVPAFGGLDLFRLARLLRGPLARRAAAAATSRDGLRNLALLTLLTIGLGGLLFSTVEPGVSVGDGLYWAVITVTTVGYGDIVPTTTTGKALAVYVMLVGVGFLAILTGAIAQRFIGGLRGRDADSGEGGALAADQDAVLAKLDELGDRLAALERAVLRDRA